MTMHAFFENILIMLIPVVVLIGGAYLALVLLNLALKLKGALREDEGLVDLWTEVQAQQEASERLSDVTDDSRPQP